MRWGVRRDKTTLRENWDSLKRERQWKKVVREIDSLTTSEIQTVSKRVGLENDLKRLTKNKSIAKDSDRADYVRRANLTDDELAVKVTRLRAKESLTKNVSDASKEQRELGEKIVNVGGTVALKYAQNNSLTAKDIFDSINNPQSNFRDKALDELVKSVTNRNVQ